MTNPEPLKDYARVQVKYDAELARILEATAKAIRARIQRAGTGVGGQIRAAQLRLTLAAINKMLTAMWASIGVTTNAGVVEGEGAAEDAIEAMTRTAYAALPEQAAEILVDGLRAAAESGLKSDAARRRRALSQRVYLQEALSKGKVEDTIRAGLIGNLSAKELAADVYQYVSPTVKGGASYAAMRLARTEINNAFHERQLEGAKRPGVSAVVWNLSGSHKVPDECNVYANHNGNGQYPVGQVPEKPHPQCFCYLTYVTTPPEEFAKQLANGDFDAEIDRRTRENMERMGQPVGNTPSPVRETPSKKPARKPSTNVKRTSTAPVQSIADFIPEVVGPPTANNIIRRWMREGKDEQYILANTKVSLDRANKLIDQAMKDFAIPAHLFPRNKASTAGSPVASTVNRSAPLPRKENTLPPVIGPNDDLQREMESRIKSTVKPGLVTKVKRQIAKQRQFVGDRIQRVTAVNQGPLSDGFEKAYAVTNVFTGEITFRPDLLSSAKSEALNRSARSGFHCSHKHDTVEGVVAHEMGHAFLNHLDFTREEGQLFIESAARIFGLPFVPPPPKTGVYGFLGMAPLVNNPRNKEIIARKVSKYAASNINEFIAEVWTGYTGDNPSREIQEMGKVIQGIISRLPATRKTVSRKGKR